MALYKFLHRVHTGLLYIQSVSQLSSTLAHCKCRTLCKTQLSSSILLVMTLEHPGMFTRENSGLKSIPSQQSLPPELSPASQAFVMSSLLLNVPDNFHLQLLQSYQQKLKFTDRKLSNFYCIWILRNRSSYFTSTHIHTLSHTHRHTL